MKSPILIALTGLALGGASCTTQNKPQVGVPSLGIAAVGGGTQTRTALSHWNRDKYPAAPEITAKSKTVLLEADGPGVVTMVHVSKYEGGDQDKLILRVWYDGEKAPAIEMPWMDFLGDVEAKTAHFSTALFSHVKESHNFRLPMPFRKHIRMEVENLTDSRFLGYTEIYWEKRKGLPVDTGYLRVAYRAGTATLPKDIVELCHLQGTGSIVAQWLQLEANHPEVVNGGLLCEGNHALFIDGSPTPQVESLGTEDLYGYSWGMQGTQSDGHFAIARVENGPRHLVTLLRCRDLDRIAFERSCRYELNYRDEYWSTRELTQQPLLLGSRVLPLSYRSAIYYYAKQP